MNEKKTAQVVLRSDGKLTLFDPKSIYDTRIVLYDDAVSALRTYFQEERDTELNRWRDPLNPDMVCFPITENNIRVLNERAGYLSCIYYRGDGIDLQSSNPYVRTAWRYFEAHPPKKPWEDANEGDIWVLTSIHGKSFPYTKNREKWVREHILVAHTDDYFVDGHRIWPES